MSLLFELISTFTNTSGISTVPIIIILIMMMASLTWHYNGINHGPLLRWAQGIHIYPFIGLRLAAALYLCGQLHNTEIYVYIKKISNQIVFFALKVKTQHPLTDLCWVFTSATLCCIFALNHCDEQVIHFNYSDFVTMIITIIIIIMYNKLKRKGD